MLRGGPRDGLVCLRQRGPLGGEAWRDCCSSKILCSATVGHEYGQQRPKWMVAREVAPPSRFHRVNPDFTSALPKAISHTAQDRHLTNIYHKRYYYARRSQHLSSGGCTHAQLTTAP